MTPARLVALLAGVLLLAALAWLIVSEHPVDHPGEPRISADPVRNLEAAMPSIGAFDSYHVNTENPFIPSAERAAEASRLDNGNKPVARPPKPPPPVVVEPSLPKITPESAGPTQPVALGITQTATLVEALALLPGVPAPVRLKIGEEQAGWRLTAVEDGIVVVLTEVATGQVSRQVVDGKAGDDRIAPKEPAKLPTKKDAKDGKNSQDPAKGIKPDKALPEEPRRLKREPGPLPMPMPQDSPRPLRPAY